MAAPALVLLHGSVVTHVIWRPQIEGLGSRFHIVTPDLPGHGARRDIPFSFGAATTAVANLIRTDAGGRRARNPDQPAAFNAAIAAFAEEIGWSRR